VPGKYTHADYHFQMSNKQFRSSANSSVKVADNDKFEVYDYPGQYAERFNKPDERLGDVEKHGDAMAKWRIEEQASAYPQITGTATCRGFTTGHFFSLLGKDSKEIKVPETSGKYVLSSVKHSITQSPDYISGAPAGTSPYRNTFTCMSQDAAFRPARTTPRP